jgi:hypothetical protein
MRGKLTIFDVILGILLIKIIPSRALWISNVINGRPLAERRPPALRSLFQGFQGGSNVIKRVRFAAPLASFLDPRIDASPSRDGKIMKEIIRQGNLNKAMPQTNDEVQLAWKIFHMNGTLAHSTETVNDAIREEKAKLPQTKIIFTDAETGEDIESVTTNEPGQEEPFTFRVGAEVREVILGWEYGVRTMREGEIASFEISPDMAFGEEGVAGIVGPNESILCEIELLAIVKNPTKQYKSIQEGESIADELMEKIQSGETPIAEQAMDRTPGGRGRVDNIRSSGSMVDPSRVVQVPQDKDRERGGPNVKDVGVAGSSPTGQDGGQTLKRQWFDPSQHQVDPNARIVGEGENHHWEETARTIDVRVPLRGEYAATVGKRELDISIEHDRVRVALSNGDVLFEGSLCGRVNTEESMWALCPAGSDRHCKEAHVQLSLEKAIGYRDIWASVIGKSSRAPSPE